MRHMSSVTLSMCASLMRPRRAEAPPSRLLLPPARQVYTTRLSTPKLPAGAGAAAASLPGRALYSGAARLQLWAAAHAACAWSVHEPAPHVDGSQGWRQRRHHAAGGAPLAMLAAVAQHPGTTDGEKQRRALSERKSLCSGDYKLNLHSCTRHGHTHLAEDDARRAVREAVCGKEAPLL
jgi:hypothetical protein